MFIEYFLDLMAVYFQSGFFQFALLPVLLLAVVATVPCLIRELVKFR